MRPYRNQYIFPPRPENKIPTSALVKYQTKDFLYEPKLDGSNTSLYMTPTTFDPKNRHDGPLTTFKLKEQEVLSLFRGSDNMVLNGEYMNKSKKDRLGKDFNHKFVIFDILVYNNEHLVGTTFEERYNLLLNLYDVKDYDEYLYQISENVFLVKKFQDCDLLTLYNNVTKIDMLEGIVIKQKSAKLENGIGRQKNTSKCQIKCRRETKNYKF